MSKLGKSSIRSENEGQAAFLAVREQRTADDLEAEQIFSRIEATLADVPLKSIYPKFEFVTVELGKEDAASFPRKLPCVRMGDYYEGVDRIRFLLDHFFEIKTAFEQGDSRRYA